MNRRGFLGLLGRLAQVGTAISIHPAILSPIAKYAPPRKLTDAEVLAQVKAMQEFLKNFKSGPDIFLAS